MNRNNRNQDEYSKQLDWLKNHYQQALYAGFQYGPTASNHLLGINHNLPVQLFDSGYKDQLNEVSTLSSIGATELQVFRRIELNNLQNSVQRMERVESTSTVLDIENDFDIPDSALMEIDIDSKYNYKMNIYTIFP
jgi:hypothetical protein